MADVSLKNISKRYAGEVRAVANVNLEIADGEFIILVGPSGCGKSTLLRMVAGLEEISEGELYIGGKLVNDLAAKDRDIAMVFQNYALYPHMTVYENMAFGLKMRKYPKAEIDKRVRQAADILDLTQYLERKPKALSGGQRQRVAVGRAIVRQPRLFLFDEPLSNLDAKLRVAMRSELIKLHKRLKATMIYVTHDQLEAMSMGDRLMVLKDGVVQQIGAPLEVYNHPANTFVAGFIGSPAMNLLSGKIVLGNGGLKFDTGSLQLDVNQVKPELANRQVTMGIRPEWININHPSAVSKFTAKVEVLERMGSDTFATLSANGHELIARFDPTIAINPDETRELSIDLTRARFFDADSGLAI
ncbi:MAG: sn-glycerol-3-phosphate ABC transporter ATP-binding protein UgpC [Acidobacteriota bacterium]